MNKMNKDKDRDNSHFELGLKNEIDPHFSCIINNNAIRATTNSSHISERDTRADTRGTECRRHLVLCSGKRLLSQMTVGQAIK